MAEAWTDPFPEYASLDVRRFGDALIVLVDRQIRELTPDIDPATGRGYIRVRYSAEAQLRKAIEDLVAQFDGVRTEHLKFLKGELIRLHRLIVQPVFLPKPAKP